MYPQPPRQPGTVIAARVLLIFQGALWALWTLLAVLVTALRLPDVRAGEGTGAHTAGYWTGYLVGAVGGTLVLVLCAVSTIVLGVRLGRGRRGARTGALVTEGILGVLWSTGAVSLVVVFARYPVPGVLAGLVLVLVAAAVPWTVFGCLLSARAKMYLTM